MGMNQKTAYKILGLGPGASLGQAKKAFRNLAKQYHPDRYPLNPGSQSPSDQTGSRGLTASLELGANQAENRMKQINQAFHLLAPLLAGTDEMSGNASTGKPPVSKERKAKPAPLFPDILRILKKGIQLKFHRKATRPSRHSGKQPPNSKPRRASRAGTPPRFATILHTLHPGAAVAARSRGEGRFRAQPVDAGTGLRDAGRDRHSRHPYGNFVKYMALKKKINARTRSHGQQNAGRIERIQPVTRVNPIGDKNRS
jgi:hypothetical protein